MIVAGIDKAFQRRVRDSNPRYPLEVYTLSRRAPSTTRTTLPKNKGGKNNRFLCIENFFCICCSYCSYFFNSNIFY